MSLHASFVRAALHGDLTEVEDRMNPWPAVAASLTVPAVFLEVSLSLSAEDAPLCLGLAQKLVAPASSLCLALASEIASAA